ncbi:Heat shock 70 kDa protein 12A [Podochytrium sp. JEL0797]|nr:Heat shock 70 kDa protein 12A [Podochytrium sp. JEL0797]
MSLEKVGNDLVIHAIDAMRLFAPSTDKTVEHLKTVVQKAPEATKLFLVGNFSVSPVLRNVFKSKVASSSLSILVPNQSGSCVMLGAVLIGNDPFQVSEHISNFAYGIRVSSSFDSTKHTPASKI